MTRRKGIRKSQDNNVPGAPGATPFRPMNGAGPGQRDPRSAGQDGQGFFFGGPGGQHNPGSGQARPQKGEPGMSYAGGTPGFYDEGGPGAPGKVYENGELPQIGAPGGAQIQPFPGGSNGGDGEVLPSFGGQFPGRGDNSIGIPRGEVGSPLNGEIPDYDFGGGRPQPPGARPAPGRGRGGRPQRPPGRGMPSGGPGLSRPQFPGMNIPQAPGMNINPTFNGDNNTYTR